MLITGNSYKAYLEFEDREDQVYKCHFRFYLANYGSFLATSEGIKQNNKYSVNIDDYRSRTFVFMKCDKYANKRWRIRITPTDWGETFLEKELLPLLERMKG